MARTDERHLPDEADDVRGSRHCRWLPPVYVRASRRCKCLPPIYVRTSRRCKWPAPVYVRCRPLLQTPSTHLRSLSTATADALDPPVLALKMDLHAQIVVQTIASYAEGDDDPQKGRYEFNRDELVSRDGDAACGHVTILPHAPYRQWVLSFPNTFASNSHSIRRLDAPT